MTVRTGFDDKKKSILTPKPETEEYGVNNFVYTARRPFHPERLYSMLKDKFFIIEQTEIDDQADGEEMDEDEDGEDKDGEDSSVSDQEEEIEEESEDGSAGLTEKQILKNKKISSFGPLLRSKGFFWLATRHIMRGEWSSAGPMLTLKGGTPWFAVSGLESVPDDTAKLIKQEFEGEFGDRRNEIVFIGLDIEKRALTKDLDSCLLNDEEFATFVAATKGKKNILKVEKELATIFEDGFEDWFIFNEEDLEDIAAEGPSKEVVKAIDEEQYNHVDLVK